MLLVLKTECAEGLRRDCRGAEAGPQRGREAAQVLPGAGGRRVDVCR
jgi:hypothetical protein